jgi:hypothetical protein
MKKGAAIIWLALLFTGIIALFWYNEWVYNLPTPIPGNYRPVSPGTRIDIAGRSSSDNNKPLFLHFFNPHCPCSRFNIPHFKSLVKQYGHEVDFAIVLVSDKPYTEREIQDLFELNIPVLSDTTIAFTCGVYSTPQAVIIGADHKLYYRGNYNKSRYCTDKKSNYAQMALDVLLHRRPAMGFDQRALKIYGCQAPKCTK